MNEEGVKVSARSILVLICFQFLCLSSFLVLHRNYNANIQDKANKRHKAIIENLNIIHVSAVFKALIDISKYCRSRLDFWFCLVYDYSALNTNQKIVYANINFELNTKFSQRTVKDFKNITYHFLRQSRNLLIFIQYLLIY